MPCCAFAVFVVLQLLGPFAVLKRRLFGDRDPHNGAVAWRFGEPAVATGAGAGRAGGLARALDWRGKAALLVAAEALVLVAAVWLVRPGSDGAGAAEDWDALVALHTTWCRPVEQPPLFSLKEPTR